MTDTKNLQIRIPAALHQKLRIIAAIKGVTVTDMVTADLYKLVEREAVKPPPLDED